MSNKHTADILKIVTESISKRRANGRKEVVMSAKKMHAIPYAQFSTEMRSGKIIKIDDGFTKLLGYTEDDVKIKDRRNPHDCCIFHNSEQAVKRSPRTGSQRCGYYGLHTFS